MILKKVAAYKQFIFGILFSGFVLFLGHSLYQNGFLMWDANGADISDQEIIVGDFGALKKVKHEWETDHLFFNNESITDNDHVGFSKKYPKHGKAEIITGWDDCGGSACGRENLVFIDVKREPVFFAVVSDILGKSIKLTKESNGVFTVVGVASSDTNELGDPLRLTMRYDRASGKLFFLPLSDASFDYRSFLGKHPDELLADENARQIFLDTMSADDFKALRYSVGVAGGIYERNHGRFIHGDGMAPHSGGDPSAHYVIDALKGNYIAAIYKDGEIEIFSDTKNKNELVYLLNDFFKQHGLAWNYDLSKSVPRQYR